MINITPDPVALQLGPVSVAWYGLGYAVALTAGVRVAQAEADRRGIDRREIVNGLFLVVAFALIGARLYHVIHQFNDCGPGGPCYRDNLLAIVLPPYSGLGLYGGIAGAVLAIAIVARRRRLPLLRLLDAAVPGLLLGQGIARWGNFFNQELYGPPTDLPWGIAIQCKNRVLEYACPPGTPPNETLGQGFHPLFFYESALDILGFLVALYLSRMLFARLRDGDLVSFWFIWYGATRAVLELFRSGYNWTFFGIPVAMLIGIVAVVGGTATLIARHRRPRAVTLRGAETAGVAADAGDGTDAADTEGEEGPEEPRGTLQTGR